MLRLVALACLLLPLACAAGEGGEPAPELPAAVQRLLDSHQAGVDRAQTAYVKAVEQLDEALVKGLEREKSKAMRAEDLALALALDAKIKEVQAEKPKTDILGKPIKAAIRPVKERLCAQPWVGTVAFLGDFVFAFKEDGTYRVTNHEGMRGTWTLDEKNQVILIKLGDDTDKLHYKDLSDDWLYEKPTVGKFPFAPKPIGKKDGDG